MLLTSLFYINVSVERLVQILVIFMSVISHYNTCRSDSSNLSNESNHKQNYYQNSFFPTSVRLFHNFPHELKSSNWSVTCFRKQLCCIYNVKLLTYSPPQYTVFRWSSSLILIEVYLQFFIFYSILAFNNIVHRYVIGQIRGRYQLGFQSCFNSCHL